MVNLIGTLGKILPTKVLIVGDFVLDSYTYGKVRRISPEAPVAVVQVTREEDRPGGAGNALLNLRSLGADVMPLGRLGENAAGERLKRAFFEEGVSLEGLFLEKGYKTPVKNRIIAENQQVVRVDHEEITPLPELLEEEILQKLPELISQVQVIAVSDYGKGFLTRSFLAALFHEAEKQHVPVIVDPKGSDYTKYQGAFIVKPNAKEAYAAAGKDPDCPIDEVGKRLLEITQAAVVMITRSELGISLFLSSGMRKDFPVEAREVVDVTGAGDTVLAMLTHSVASGIPIEEATLLCNVVAGMAIERFGCARISLAELARRLLYIDSHNKVFDEEHLFVLQKALMDRSYTILGVSSERGLTSAIYTSIQKLASKKKGDLLIYIREKNPDLSFVHLLSSLREVDFIILKTESLQHFVSLISPSDVLVVEGDELKTLHAPHALLS